MLFRSQAEPNGDRDLRRDFPWEVIGDDQHPSDNFPKEKQIYDWTRDLIALRKKCQPLQSGATITLWSDQFLYAFLRVSIDEVAFVIINNGYDPMPSPVRIPLNKTVLSDRAIAQISSDLKHWKTGRDLLVTNNCIEVAVDGKTIDIYTR